MNAKRIVLLSLFIALSAVLSNIKIFSTIAFDSMPAFLAAMIISPVAGGIVGAFGHLLSASTSGFPLSIPMHLFIALQMLMIVWFFGILFEKYNKYLAIFISIILNGPVATYLSGILITYLDVTFTVTGFFKLMALPLTIVSAVNIMLAFSIMKVIKRARIQV